MGHKAGTDFSGARGLQRDVDTFKALEDREEEDVRALAREYTKEAIITLRQIMRNRKSHPASRIKAATSLIEFGHGKAPQQAPHDVDTRKLTINIIRLSTGEKERVEINVTPPDEIEAKVEELLEGEV